MTKSSHFLRKQIKDGFKLHFWATRLIDRAHARWTRWISGRNLDFIRSWNKTINIVLSLCLPDPLWPVPVGLWLRDSPKETLCCYLTWNRFDPFSRAYLPFSCRWLSKEICQHSRDYAFFILFYFFYPNHQKTQPGQRFFGLTVAKQKSFPI